MTLEDLSLALTQANIRHSPLLSIEGFYLKDSKVSLIVDRGLSQGPGDLAQAKPEAPVVVLRGEASMVWFLEMLRRPVDLLARQKTLMEALRDEPVAGFVTKEPPPPLVLPPENPQPTLFRQERRGRY